MIKPKIYFNNLRNNDAEILALSIKYLPKIIILSGPTKSGKSIFAKHLAAQYDYKYVSPSFYIRKFEYTFSGKSGDWHSLGNRAEEIRRSHEDPAYFSELVFSEIKKIADKTKKFIIDSFLLLDELNYFKNVMGNTGNLIYFGFDTNDNLRKENAINWYRDQYMEDITLKIIDFYIGYRKGNKDQKHKLELKFNKELYGCLPDNFLVDIKKKLDSVKKRELEQFKKAIKTKLNEYDFRIGDFIRKDVASRDVQEGYCSPQINEYRPNVSACLDSIKTEGGEIFSINNLIDYRSIIDNPIKYLATREGFLERY